ncbi:HEAT repeat domain-containing protein [Thalassoroseus pseudoceratinae]|uniref:HEAT repeat domain-containing protein n=1 Tax=Thalassoroseus pseudoceratinae TaxID=2713176 RepID=UPI00141F1674|nr:HEAT repeat domain-containing protein [Thalassoroseus pseudoceratinae]
MSEKSRIGSKLRWLSGLCLVVVLSSSVCADEPQSAVAPLMKLLQSGRLPDSRVGSVVELVGRRGNEHDLKYLFDQSVSKDGYAGETRVTALKTLLDAAQNRKVKPAGDLAALKTLLTEDQDNATRGLAVQLAGQWKVTAVAPTLKALALDTDENAELQSAAIDGLTQLGGEAAQSAILELTSEKYPQSLRYQGVAALTKLDAEAAAKRAAEVLANANTKTDPAPVVDAFLVRQNGTDLLAAALQETPPPADVAKMALRHLFGSGRNDKALSDVLSEAAGVSQETPQLTKAEIAKLAADVVAKGDPARGEAIFRSADLSCMKCHAVSKAGGNVGPDLSAVGQSSPVDYLINSILYPSQAIKEAYLTRVVLTASGEVHQGVVVDQAADRLVLKDANGKEITIPTADIDFEKEGKSLMPQGLTKFLTQDELIDLVRFLSELGKPGRYAVRSTPRMQRWRVLAKVPALLAQKVPDEEEFGDALVHAENVPWQPSYARVDGTLPLDQLAEDTQQTVLYVRGDVEVTASGRIGFQLDSAEGVSAWVDGQAMGSDEEFVAELDRGTHAVVFRVDTEKRSSNDLKLELFQPNGSSAQFAVVDGK